MCCQVCFCTNEVGVSGTVFVVDVHTNHKSDVVGRGGPINMNIHNIDINIGTDFKCDFSSTHFESHPPDWRP